MIAPGSSDELRPGLHRLVLPLAGHSIGHVNAYALQSDDGLMLIDCGWSTPDTRAVLETLVTSLDPGRGRINALLLTHAHIAHCGLLGWAPERGAIVAMHQADAGQLVDRYLRPEPLQADTEAWLAWSGVPADLWPGQRAQLTAQQSKFWPGAPDRLLEPGSVIEHGSFRLEVIHTPGHTPGSISFFEHTTRTLFTGDTLFARSTLSPTLRPFASSDPMTDYLASIRRLSRPNSDLVLPGHHEPFIGLVERVDSVLEHHERRAEEIAHASRRDGTTAWELTALLSRKRPWKSLVPGMQILSTSEVCAHLRRLAGRGQIEECPGPPSTWRARDIL